MRFCTKCGKDILPNKGFCTSCGNAIKNNNIKENEITSEESVEPINIQKSERNEKKVEQNESSSSLKANVDYEQQESITKCINKNSKRKVFSGVFLKIIIGVFLVLIILSTIFFNKIKGVYYIYKCNNSIVLSEKLNYASKAVEVLKTGNSKELLKTSLIGIAQTDIGLAESKLVEVKNLLSQDEYKIIVINIKEKKIDDLYSRSEYEEVFREFDELNKLGVDFKSNKNYEYIMLNVISDITNTSLENTKDTLMKHQGIYFDNFDEDPFDEILQLEKDYYTYNSELKLNLYKFKNGQYTLVDKVIIGDVWDWGIQGAYDYAENNKGLFVYYINSTSNIGTSVFGISDEKIKLKGTVFANNYTKPDDIDGDGIYEILANSVSVISSSDKGISKWYKIYEDARIPTELVLTQQQVENSTVNYNEYIFVDSNKRYLTESELQGLTKEQLAIARNEIFARHGYIFNMEEFKEYFNSKSWYTPDSGYDGSDSILNEYEIYNYKFIQELEKR